MDLIIRKTMLLYILLNTRYSNTVCTNKTFVCLCVQNLRKKVQEMKFNCYLNEDKLHYKYELLKKREEENAILKSLLKRKIIRY